MVTRRNLLAAGTAGLILTLAGCASRPGGQADGRIMTREAIPRVNAFRTANGQAPLSPSGSASAAALDHARRMAESGQMAHNIGWRADFAQRMRDQRVPLPAAENIATGQASVERALAAWENSAGHRGNTLDERFSGVGVAVAFSPDDNRPYWAMVLAAG